MTHAPSTSAPRPAAVFARALAVILVFVAGLAVIVVLTRDELAAARSTAVTRIVAGAVVSATVLAAVVALSRRDRRPLSAAGLPGAAGWARGLAVGALAWLVPAAIAVAVLGAGAASFRPPLADAWITVSLVLAAVLLSEALPEEVAFRGYAQATLALRLGEWAAIVVQAALFTAVGVGSRLATGPLAPTDVLVFAGMGIGLGYLRARSGDIAVTVGFHAAFQTGAQLVLAHDLLGPVDPGVLFPALGPIPFAIGIAALVMIAGRARPSARPSPRRRLRSAPPPGA